MAAPIFVAAATANASAITFVGASAPDIAVAAAAIAAVIATLLQGCKERICASSAVGGDGAAADVDCTLINDARQQRAQDEAAYNFRVKGGSL